MQKISIIVPIYNEKDVIKIFYNELISVISNLDYKFELLFIDDGSNDESLSIIKEISNNDKFVKYISFSRNFGKESAIFAGFFNAKDSDYCLIMDCDLQDPPSLIPTMIDTILNSNYDCVATRRKNRNNESIFKSFCSDLFYTVINKIVPFKIRKGSRDFRILKKDVVCAIISLSESVRFSKGIFEFVGFNTYFIEYDNVARIAGKTKWNYYKLFKYALDGIINFSEAPLSFISFMGYFFTFLSFVFLIIIILRRLVFGDPVSGWASIVCIIIFFGGIQIFFIGIIGRYLSRTYIETKRRPHYIIKDTNKEGVEKIK